MHPSRRDLASFFGRITVAETGCWFWHGAANRKGYGMFRANGAHRWSYRAFVEAIPPGYQIDHLCRVRRCVNPAHLEAVTPLVNFHRSNSWQRTQRCRRRGHDISDQSNVYFVVARGVLTRNCLACRRITRAQHWYRLGVRRNYVLRVLGLDAKEAA